MTLSRLSYLILAYWFGYSHGKTNGWLEGHAAGWRIVRGMFEARERPKS